MGTNFYIKDQDVTIHIGKRSSSGYYCYTCNTTLCAEGNSGVHSGLATWCDNCPICGSSPEEEGPVLNSTSFTFAIDPVDFFTLLIQKRESITIFNEYNTFYNEKELIEILNDCPIKFYNLIGEDFC